MTPFDYLSFCLKTYCALVEAFRLGEQYGRSLQTYLAQKDETEDRGWEAYRKMTQDERDNADAKEAEEWDKFQAENWHPGCGRKIPVVTCKLCETDYAAYEWGSPNQGRSCCAWITERNNKRVLHGGYGSCVADMQEFVVIPEAYEDLSVGLDPICDGCILSMLADGFLVRERWLNPEYH